jgi:hypothetical protein
MAIQVSTVASESAFSAAGRVLDPYRNRLDPEIVEALICTKDWVAAARKGDDLLLCTFFFSSILMFVLENALISYFSFCIQILKLLDQL